jgi:RNA polymerase sigma factor (sigma-70 family)
MSSEFSDFSARDDEEYRLFERARRGDSKAVQELFDKYEKHFLIVIRQRLLRRVRSIVDSVDLLQDIRLKLFVKDLPDGVFASRQTFIAYVAKIAANSVGQLHRKYLVYAKRNLRHEEHLKPSLVENAAVDSSPAAADLLCEADLIAYVLHRLRPVHRRVAKLALQGRTCAEIAKQLQLNERTVRRLLQQIRVTSAAES